MNGLYAVVLVFCLKVDPWKCEEHRPFLETFPFQQCMLLAMREAAEWATTHEEWEIKDLRCEPPEKRKVPT